MSTAPPSTPSLEPPEPAAPEPRLRWSQRLLLWFVPSIAALLIRLLGSTLRYQVAIDGSDQAEFGPKQIFAFWHQCILVAAYRYRGRGAAVLTSQSFDGELIARTIQKLGFIPVRGSSSRGGVSGLLGLHEILEQGGSVAFTADGPRGPKFIAKPGPVLLSQKTGAPVRALHLAVSKSWQLGSWDQMIIPKPYAKVLLRIEAPVYPNDNSALQSALDQARENAASAANSRA